MENQKRLAEITVWKRYRFWFLFFPLHQISLYFIDGYFESRWEARHAFYRLAAATLSLLIFWLFASIKNRETFTIDVDESGFNLDFWRQKHRVEWAQIARVTREIKGQEVTTTLFDANEFAILRWSYGEGDTKETRAAFEALEREMRLKTKI